MRILYWVITGFILAATCAGQQSKPTPSPSTSATIGWGETKVTVDIPATSYRKVGQAEVSYFAESDTTEVRAELEAYRSKEESANMYFVFTVKGKRLIQPKSVTVGIAFFTDKEKAEHLNGLKLEADRKSLNLDDLNDEGVGYDYNAKSSYRAMTANLPFTIFEELVGSKSVRVYIGDVGFDLAKKNHDALRDMLKAVERH